MGHIKRVIAFSLIMLLANSFTLAQDTTLTVTANGKVGIGTTSPEGTFDVSGADPVIYIQDTETLSANARVFLKFSESDNDGSPQAAFRIGQDSRTFRIAFSAEDTQTGIYNDLFTVKDDGFLGLRISPVADLHIKQSQAITSGGTGGLMLEDADDTDNWQVHHSGLHLSFTENGTRRSYITAATGELTVVSDKRFKKNIEGLPSVLDGVLKLNPLKYHYLGNAASAVKTSGFLAQEVAEVFPDLVRHDEDGNMGLAYDNFAVLAIKAIQEQQAIIEQLKQDIEALKN